MVGMACSSLSLLLLSAAGDLPRWTAPPFHGTGTVGPVAAYGLRVAQGSRAAKLYNATLETGVYSHAPMLGLHGGYFLASWKNGPTNEDTPGQRVLWSYASAASPLGYSPPLVLFPNVSDGSGCATKNHGPYRPPNTPYLSPGGAHLFAEPLIELNGRAYMASSLRQYCLYPLDPLNEGGKYLLLRRVTTASLSSGTGTGTPQLGEMFWAADPGPEWANTSSRLNIRALHQMDSDTQSDIAGLMAGQRPCAAGASKCEFCEGGCQDLRAAGAPDAPCALEDVGGPWIERTHWKVPHQETDVLVYRSTKTTLNLCFSQRDGGANATWSPPQATELADIHSNFNAGTLPDGRVYLLHNPIARAPHSPVGRDPLVVSLSSDGWSFGEAFVITSCLLPPITSKGVTGGCDRRNKGSGSHGPQYPQGLVHGASLYIIMSMNSEYDRLLVSPLLSSFVRASSFPSPPLTACVLLQPTEEDIWVQQTPLAALDATPLS